MGLIGLGDPVYALSVRDRWISWDSTARREWLRCVLDAFVLGAVPPYSNVLGGELVALLATSTEVRRAFADRYARMTTLISQRDPDARLAGSRSSPDAVQIGAARDTHRTTVTPARPCGIGSKQLARYS